MKMLNSLHFTRGFTKVLQSGIWILNEGKTPWDTLSALQVLCGSQRSHCVPKIFYNLKLLSPINCPWVLEHRGGFSFFSEDSDLPNEFSRKGMIDFAFQPNYLFSPSSHFFKSFFIILLRCQSPYNVCLNSHTRKEKCPSIIWSRCNFNTQSLDCTWRLWCGLLFRK